MLSSRRLCLEELEVRELLAGDWFSTYIANGNIANLIRNDWYGHGSVTRSDMLAVFSQAERDGHVDSSEMDSLKFLSSYGYLLNMTDVVQYLTGKVVNGDPGNSTYQYLDKRGNEVTTSLSNLRVGSSSTQLTELVNKWFLGVNEPVAAVSYSAANGSLFSANGPVFTDVEQGSVGDCWLLASLAEAAARQPNLIRNMFIDDGTNLVNGQTVEVWTVGFFTNGAVNYVTVDTELPSDGWYYDRPANGVLWAALAEKAYAEANGSGMVQTATPSSNSYRALNAGYAWWALTAITGQPASGFAIDPSNAASALQAGELVVLSTNSPQSSYIVPSHCYALVGYDPSSSAPFKVYNPWGTNSSGWAFYTYNGQPVYGLFTVNAAFISQNFDEQDIAAAAPGTVREQLSFVSSTTPTRNGNQAVGPLLATILVAGSWENAADGPLHHGFSKPAIQELSVLQLDYFAARTFGAGLTNETIE
jgi:hypothetical protein